MRKFLTYFTLILGVTMLTIPFIQTYANGLQDPVTLLSQPPTRSALLSNRYTQLEQVEPTIDQNLFADLIDYEFVATFQPLSLYVRRDNLMFRVVDERSGYIWASSMNYDYFSEDSPLADEGDYQLNAFWENKLNSPVLVNFYAGVNLREENLFESVRSTFVYTPIETTQRRGFKADIRLGTSQIDFSLEVTLDGNGLHIHIPQSSILERGDAKLASITPYPMLGATKRLRTPGYVVVPDGVGALLRFDDDETKGVYTKRFFGADASIGQTQTEQPLNANMYGVVHGTQQHAMLGIVSQGSGNAILTHIGSLVLTDMNWTYVSFSYRTAYVQYLNQAKTSSVSLVQSSRNTFDASLTFQFLTDEEADYTGIAKQYASWLYGDQTIITNDRIPLHLDVLALDSKPGFFARQKVVMTSYTQLQSMTETLVEQGLSHLHLSYLGWNEGGYSYTAPNFGQRDGILGSARDEQNFLSFIDDYPIEMYYGVNPFLGYTRGGGYSTNDVVQTIGQELLVHDDYFVLKPSTSLNKIAQLTSPSNQWAYEYIGDRLMSDYQPTLTDRETTRTRLSSSLSEQTQAVYRPFSYFFHSQSLLDTPMYSSQQGRFSDTVPLLPLIFNNRTHAFGRAGNFFSNTQNELLRLIDYGIYPSFFVTHASAYELMDTPSNYIFTSKFSDWKDEIKRQYDYVSLYLNEVYGSEIIKRTVLDIGLVEITYDHGRSILVNYSGETYTVDGTTIEPLSAKVISHE